MIRKFIPNSFINYGKHLPEAILANFKFKFPGRKIRVIGVTGSDGKTTTVNMIYKILHDANLKCSMISTINAKIGERFFDTGFHVTNPSASDLQKFLSESAKNGDEFMILEVTSHGLAQFRVWGIPFEIGVITNITHEHLDYHKTFENYLQAKAKLIKKSRFVILNADDRNFSRLKKMASGKIISFGFGKGADVNLINFPIKLSIIGNYNLANALAAAAVGKILGIDNKLIKNSLEDFKGLPGRMEEIENNKGICVVVDFAHTPNALEQALQTLRKITSGKLFSVFGSAGARDRGKRPMMGEISARIADVTVLTDEDPRFEDRNKIIEEIAQGAYSKGAKNGINLFKEPDRIKAINLALTMAKKGDTVGIFGKGHEKSMSYKGIEKPWSDQDIAAKILKNI